MSQPFLIAMEHDEWHTSFVLKKRNMKRPLGKLERQYNYNPPQPVLSCRTVNIDLSGTRTYRAKSATDIINEQHHLVHGIYRTKRNSRSAPIRRKTKHSDREGKPQRGIKFLQVEGNRPHSSTDNYGRGHEPQIGLKRRPNTTDTRHLRTKAVTDTRLDIRPSPSHVEAFQAFREVNDQVRNQWTDENHDLTEGNFIRGKKPEENMVSLDPKTGNQWLSFGGGNTDRSEGLVDAFADMYSSDMKSSDEYYHIDGSSGIQVAKKLNNGDRIRIGINGSVYAYDLRQRRYRREETFDSDSPRSVTSPIPLCWDDQLAEPTAKVVPASTPKTSRQMINLNETRPVIYKEFENTDSDLKRSKARVSEGYQVSTRTKSRKGLDGRERPSSTITSISIDRNKTSDPLFFEKISYEDIIDMKIQSNGKPKDTNEIEIVNVSKHDANEKTQERQVIHKEVVIPVPSSARSDVVEPPTSRPEESTPVCRSRPLTAHSMTNIDPDVESLRVGSTSSMAGSRPGTTQSMNKHNHHNQHHNPPDSPSKRPTNPSRPPPLKPHLHKTSAASGASINGTKRGEPEYIQITKNININRDDQKSLASQSNEAINSVKDYQTSDGRRTPAELEDQSSEPTMKLGPAPMEIQSLKRPHQMTPIKVPPSTPQKDEEESPPPPKDIEPTPAPPPTMRQNGETENVKYAFKVPTADVLDCEDSVMGQRSETPVDNSVINE